MKKKQKINDSALPKQFDTHRLTSKFLYQMKI